MKTFYANIATWNNHGYQLIRSDSTTNEYYQIHSNSVYYQIDNKPKWILYQIIDNKLCHIINLKQPVDIANIAPKQFYQIKTSYQKEMKKKSSFPMYQKQQQNHQINKFKHI